MIELKNINKVYKNGKNYFQALKNINLKIENKGLIIILGKSGSGKSTLLNILGGLDSCSSGELIIDNKSTTYFKNKDYDNYRNNYVGFVFQEFNLVNELTINENVEVPLKLRNIKNRSSRIDDTLSLVNLNSIGHKKCNELSGGQRQRVAIARALIKDPKLLLCDEPTGALDSNTSIEIFELFKKISKERLVIIVTHNEELAFNYGNRIIKISDGEIVEDITRVNKDPLRKIASNVIEVDSDYKITKQDLDSIIDKPMYIGVSTNYRELSLVYDEILDYKKENKEEFKKTVINNDDNNDVFDSSTSSLNYMDAFQLAKDNLKNNRKKYRFLNTIFSSFSIILIVAFLFSFLSINSFIAKQTISKKSLDIIEVSHLITKTKKNEITTLITNLNNENYGYVNNYNLTPHYGDNIEKLNFVSESFSGILEIDDLNNLNLELSDGTKTFNNYYEIIISDYMAYNFSKYGVLLLNDNKLEIYYPVNNSDLLDKEIRIEETNKNYKIIGIYETDFNSLLIDYNKGDENASCIINSNVNFLYSKLIAKEGFYKQYKEDYKDYNFYEEDEIFVINLNSNNDKKKFYFSDTRLLLNKDKIKEEINLYDLHGEIIELPDSLNENEIILSLDQVLEMFGEENKTIIELLRNSEIYNYLNDEKLILNLSQNNAYSSTDKEDINILKGVNVKVIGILGEGNRLFVSNNIYDGLNNHLDGYDSVYFLNNDNSLALESKIEKISSLDNKFIVGNSLVNIDNTKILNEVIEIISSVFIVFTIIFLLLSFLICLNYMNILVKTRYKELTLYRTLGAKKKDIYKIFAFESLNISIKALIIGIIGSFLLTYLLNEVLISIINLDIEGIKILSFNIWYCLLAFISIFAICLLASYLSVKGLLKKKLVDAFKVN